MPVELDDKVVKDLPAPAKGNAIHYDTKVKGFGCRVTAAGAKSFVFNYRTRDGRERRYTIGQYPSWKVAAARREADALKYQVRNGDDPLQALANSREARRQEAALATVDTLCDRFEALHVAKLRPATARDYKSIIRLYVRPKLGKLKVRDVGYAHVEALHRAVSKQAPTRANRVAAVLSKMFSFAAKTPAADPDHDDRSPPIPMRPDGVNPARGLERNPEGKRDRYLSRSELAALNKALAEAKDRQAADIIRLLTLTGARKGELMAARWPDFDLVGGTWTKPGATTKQKTLHHVPLSPPAVQLLKDIRTRAEASAKEKDRELAADAYVFPGRRGGCRTEIKDAWNEICVAAKLVRPVEIPGPDGKLITILKPTARIHDLRHTYASVLASSGLSLPIIGALLGHTQASTTNRYSHLMLDRLREATGIVGAALEGAPAGAAGGDDK